MTIKLIVASIVTIILLIILAIVNGRTADFIETGTTSYSNAATPTIAATSSKESLTTNTDIPETTTATTPTITTTEDEWIDDVITGPVYGSGKVETDETTVEIPVATTEIVTTTTVNTTSKNAATAPKDPEPTPSAPYYRVTADEREMLAHLIYLEAGNCSVKCQRAVASVVFNRLESGCWNYDKNKDGKITLYDIIYYPNAFTPARRIATTTASQSSYDAVDYVIQHGPTMPTYVRYFRMSYDFKWKNYKNYCVIDNTYFGYFTDWQTGRW